jgi:hemoglobin
MTSLLRSFALAFAALCAVSAHAQPAASAPGAGLQAPADDRLFRELGGRDGVTRLAEAIVPRLVADEHLGEFFKHVPPEPLKAHLAQMLCVVSGGGCAYEGRGMLEVHKDMDISRTDFNAVVRVLQDTMDALRIPFATQNRLLARLAPMHREIVTTHAG